MDKKLIISQKKEELETLINQARSEKKWLHMSFRDLWFTPAELEKEINRGNYIYDIENFELRDPEEMIYEAEKLIDTHYNLLPWYKKLCLPLLKDMRKLFKHKAKVEKKVREWESKHES